MRPSSQISSDTMVASEPARPLPPSSERCKNGILTSHFDSALFTRDAMIHVARRMTMAATILSSRLPQSMFSESMCVLTLLVWLKMGGVALRKEHELHQLPFKFSEMVSRSVT